MNPDNGPEALQRKVQFDLRFYFCRRGMENMDKMKKNDFQVRYNTKKEEWYVIKVKDELTKNHCELENIVSGIMPENKTDRLCPVKSFQKYLDHLNPNCDFLWQYALEKINPEKPNVWYSRRNIRKNTLGIFMSEVSKQCKLSTIYTNHSIRVIGCTVLTRCNLSSSEIMSVSGHKSVQSLAIYQKTRDHQKHEMGKALFDSMTKKEEDITRMQCVTAPKQMQALPPPEPTVMSAQSETALVPAANVNENFVPFQPNFEDHDDVTDVDLLSALCGINENADGSINSVTTTLANTRNTSNFVTMPNSMFANCQIGTINITINKS